MRKRSADGHAVPCDVFFPAEVILMNRPSWKPLEHDESISHIGNNIMNCDSDHDGRDSFSRVPISATQPKVHRMAMNPTRRICSSPSTNTLVTLETAPSSTGASYECDNLQYPPLLRAGSESEQVCWGNSVLQNLFSLISPTKKKNAFSSHQGTDVNENTPIKNRVNVQRLQLLQFDLRSNSNSEISLASPTGVQDLSPSLNDRPCKPLLYDCPRTPNDEEPLTEEEQQEDSQALDQDFLLPSESNLSGIGLSNNLQPQFAEQQHQDDSGAPHHFLHAASKYEENSNLDAAISCLEQFLYQSRFSTNTSVVYEHSKATILHKLGTLQWKCGKYLSSEHVLSDCLHMYKRLLDHDPNSVLHDTNVRSQMVLETAHVLLSLGRVYLSKGEGDAMQCYNDCVKHLSSIPTPCRESAPITPARIFAQACVGAGRVLASQGRSRAALRRYKRALKTQLGYQGLDSPVAREEIYALSIDEARVPLNDIAETLSHLGRLYEQQHDLSRAMECHTKSLALYQSVLDSDAVDIGYASNNLGQVYIRTGKVAEAEKAFKTAHQVFSLRLGNNHRNTADALLSIGRLYASQGLHKKALTTFKCVARSKAAVFGELLAATLHSIACSYDATFRLDQALKYYQREVNVLTTLSSHNVSAARILHHIAKIAIQAVDCNGEYLLLDQTQIWLEEAAGIYFHSGNRKKVHKHELLHLESSLEDIRDRIERRHRSTLYDELK